MQEMYNAKLGSPITTLAEDISSSQTTITVADASFLGAAPNIATITTGVNSETVKYTGITLNTLTGVTRGFQGSAQAWASGTNIARIITAYDHDAFLANINEVDGDLATHKADLTTDADGAHGLKIEEGSWTPTLRGATTAGNNTYSLRQGSYIKIGNSVFLSGRLILSAKDAAMSGEIRISGLPFTPKNTVSVTIGTLKNVVFIADIIQATFLITALSTEILLLHQTDNNTPQAFAPTSINATTDIAFSATYQV